MLGLCKTFACWSTFFPVSAVGEPFVSLLAAHSAHAVPQTSLHSLVGALPHSSSMSPVQQPRYRLCSPGHPQHPGLGSRCVFSICVHPTYSDLSSAHFHSSVPRSIAFSRPPHVSSLPSPETPSHRHQPRYPVSPTFSFASVWLLSFCSVLLYSYTFSISIHNLWWLLHIPLP